MTTGPDPSIRNAQPLQRVRLLKTYALNYVQTTASLGNTRLEFPGRNDFEAICVRQNALGKVRAPVFIRGSIAKRVSSSSRLDTLHPIPYTKTAQSISATNMRGSLVRCDSTDLTNREAAGLQGYLAHKRQRPPSTLQ